MFDVNCTSSWSLQYQQLLAQTPQQEQQYEVNNSRVQYIIQYNPIQIYLNLYKHTYIYISMWLYHVLGQVLQIYFSGCFMVIFCYFIVIFCYFIGICLLFSGFFCYCLLFNCYCFASFFFCYFIVNFCYCIVIFCQCIVIFCYSILIFCYFLLCYVFLLFFVCYSMVIFVILL